MKNPSSTEGRSGEPLNTNFAAGVA